MALSACSDGSSDGSPDGLAGFDAEFADLASAADGLAPTDTSTLPTSGSADYEGVIRLTSPVGGIVPDAMSGTLGLVLDFGSGAITGEATDFVKDDDESLEGSLDVSGDFTRDPGAANDLVAGINGLIYVDTGPVEDEGQWFVTGTLQGDFLGEDGQVVRGDVSAEAGDPLFGPDEPIDGDFIAER